MFITSAPSRLPASSKDAWVRVEDSKNRFIWVRPRSDLTIQFNEFFGKVEKTCNLAVRKPLDPQQMTAVEDEGRFRGDVH
jgi:hypothetical protein